MKSPIRYDVTDGRRVWLARQRLTLPHVGERISREWYVVRVDPIEREGCVALVHVARVVEAPR